MAFLFLFYPHYDICIYFSFLKIKQKYVIILFPSPARM